MFICSHEHLQSDEIFESPDVHSQLGLNKLTLPSCLTSHSVNTCPFLRIFSATFFFFAFLCFLWYFHFKMTPKHSSEDLLGLVSLFQLHIFSLCALNLGIEQHPSAYSSDTYQSCSDLCFFSCFLPSRLG